MAKTLFVNACVRENSRTLCLAKAVLERICGEYTEVDLQRINLQPLDAKGIEKRERLVSQGDFSDAVFDLAKDFAAADTIVVAAPYWDLSFPSLLKVYLEQVAVCGITFEYKKGTPHGLCRAERLIYVTTAGGSIYQNLGFEYVKALCKTLFSVSEVMCFTAEGLDIRGAAVQKIMADAKRRIKL